MKRIIITGGGTAGHAYPVIMVGKILHKNHRLKLIYVGLRSGIERKLAKDAQLPFYGILTGKKRAYFSLLNFLDLFKILIGLLQAFVLFIAFRPNLIFAKGGYVTYPIVFWAKIFNTTLVIHESDIVMGRSNIGAAKAAKKICLGFPISYFFKYNNLKIPIQKLIYTGIPLREEFFKNDNNQEDQKTILFTGGSQGSSKINQILQEGLSELTKKYKIIHIAGKVDFDSLKVKNENTPNYTIYEYNDDIALLMKKSDLIISRAGANTLAEISALSKPSILIPLPSASKDHQTINAKVYNEKNAALMISEKSLTSSSLISIINRLMEDEKLRKLIGHHAHEFVAPDAAKEIINILFEVQ